MHYSGRTFRGSAAIILHRVVVPLIHNLGAVVYSLYESDLLFERRVKCMFLELRPSLLAGYFTRIQNIGAVREVSEVRGFAWFVQLACESSVSVFCLVRWI